MFCVGGYCKSSQIVLKDHCHTIFSNLDEFRGIGVYCIIVRGLFVMWVFWILIDCRVSRVSSAINKIIYLCVSGRLKTNKTIKND